MLYLSSSGRVCLRLSMREALAMSHAGPCDADVAYYFTVPPIARQLAQVDPLDLRADLSELGAWNAEELADHSANLRRLLWVAACDIKESRK